VNRSIGATVMVSALIATSAASAQGMLLDFAADKVIKKYQTSTCDELKAQRKETPTDKEKEAIEFLRNDSQARIFFINKIAAPVLNKMFDCGMIP
jgi:replication initiation and membrane attachment protein DnaB